MDSSTSSMILAGVNGMVRCSVTVLFVVGVVTDSTEMVTGTRVTGTDGCICSAMCSCSLFPLL
jgi:hypothetical protein